MKVTKASIEFLESALETNNRLADDCQKQLDRINDRSRELEQDIKDAQEAAFVFTIGRETFEEHMSQVTYEEGYYESAEAALADGLKEAEDGQTVCVYDLTGKLITNSGLTTNVQ